MQNKIFGIFFITNGLTLVVCCLSASGFKVMLFSRLIEKAWIQFDSCRKKYTPHRHCGAVTEQGKLLFTNTQLGQRQTEHNLIWVHIWDLRLGGFGIENTHTTDIYQLVHKLILILITYL